MKTAATVLFFLLVSLLGFGCVSSDSDSDEFGRPNYSTIDGIWRVNADEVYDDCNSEENPCVEGEDDECINSNEWFWVTVQDYGDGIFTADFAMSDLAWYDVVVGADGAFDNTLDLSDFGWFYRIYGTIIPEEILATIELNFDNVEFQCQIIYEIWGYPMYNANNAAREALEDGGVRYNPLF